MLELFIGSVYMGVDLDVAVLHSFDMVGEGVVGGDVGVSNFGDVGVNICDGGGDGGLDGVSLFLLMLDGIRDLGELRGVKGDGFLDFG